MMTNFPEELTRWIGTYTPRVMIDDERSSIGSPAYKCIFCKKPAHTNSTTLEYDQIDHAPDCMYTRSVEWVRDNEIEESSTSLGSTEYQELAKSTKAFVSSIDMIAAAGRLMADPSFARNLEIPPITAKEIQEAYEKYGAAIGKETLSVTDKQTALMNHMIERNDDQNQEATVDND